MEKQKKKKGVGLSTTIFLSLLLGAVLDCFFIMQFRQGALEIMF